MDLVNKRNTTIDAMKGIASLFVIISHTYLNINNVFLDNAIMKIALSIQMPLFFVVSGWLFSNNASFPIFLKRKFKLVYFFLVYSIIFFLARGCPLPFLEYAQAVLKDPVYNSSWFLLSLFTIEIVFFVIDKFLNKNIVLLSLIVIVLCFIKVNIPIVDLSALYLRYFYIGFLFKNCNNKVSCKVNIIILLVSYSILLSQWKWSGLILNDYFPANTYYILLKSFTELYKTITSILGISIIYSLLKVVKNRIVITFLSFIGQNSLIFYLLHVLLLPMMITSGPNAIIINITNFAMLTSICIIASLLKIAFKSRMAS